MRPRVLLIRGHQANSWHLRPWRHLADRYDVTALTTDRAWFDTSSMGLPSRRTRTLRGLLPPGPGGDLLVRVPGDRYLQPARAFSDYDVIHSQDLGFWYSAQAARLKQALGHKLVLTCWETIPFLGSYRNIRTRPYRELVLDQADLFLATSVRARRCLELEGAASARIAVCPPGVDDELFGHAPTASAPTEHLIVSAGRLVWDKGHQDVLRAVAALVRGAVPGLPSTGRPRVLVVGRGPEEGRLRRYARELGIADRFELRPEVPYAEMPELYARASGLVLASLPTWSWEEQFGMVMIEARFAGLPVIAAASGAIPEVLGDEGDTFAPGDWEGLATLLARTILSKPPGQRRSSGPALEQYSGRAYSDRLAAAYQKVIGA